MSTLRTAKKLVIAALIAAGNFGVAHAQVALENKVFVESFVTAKDGTMDRQLKPAATVVPGDRLVYVISYRNNGKKPSSDVVVTNPISPTVEFIGEETAGAEMSIDGGKTYGQLAQMRVRNPDGTQRAARRSDVTHLRWRVAGAVAPGASGQVSFKARLK